MPARVLTDVQAADIARRYRAGATVRDLAAHFHCCKATIGSYLAAAGVARRRRGRTPEYAQGLRDAAALLLGDLAGCTAAEAADALLRRAGAIQTRPPVSKECS